MKATIRDPEVLRTIRPLDLASYLRASGWREETQIADKASVWLRGNQNDAFEILLPLDPSLRDFTTRMGEALSTLEAAEQRSQLEILSDLNIASADVVRIRSLKPDAEDGSIPIDDGVVLVQRARDAMVAAACSTLDPRAYYHTRKPDQALEYARKLRLGQTERGSYVVTVISPVPPALAPPEGTPSSLFPEILPDPFERQVTRMLSSALAATRSAATQAITTGSFEPFSANVQKGVSANLCEALAGMASKGGLELSLSWARTRAVPLDAPGRVVLPPDAIPVIEEAGRIFRAASPEPSEVHGYVIRLHRPPDAERGEVTILDDAGERPRRVTVDLAGADYKAAAGAHLDGTPVTCCGDLAKEGSSFRLRNPHCFGLGPDAP